MATNDSEQTTTIVDINIQGISEDTFKQILARVTTTIANVIFNENYTVDNIYDHVEFIDGDITEITVQNMRKKTGKQNE